MGSANGNGGECKKLFSIIFLQNYENEFGVISFTFLVPSVLHMKSRLISIVGNRKNGHRYSFFEFQQ